MNKEIQRQRLRLSDWSRARPLKPRIESYRNSWKPDKAEILSDLSVDTVGEAFDELSGKAFGFRLLQPRAKMGFGTIAAITGALGVVSSLAAVGSAPIALVGALACSAAALTAGGISLVSSGTKDEAIRDIVHDFKESDSLDPPEGWSHEDWWWKVKIYGQPGSPWNQSILRDWNVGLEHPRTS